MACLTDMRKRSAPYRASPPTYETNPPPKAPEISPIFKAESVSPTISASKDGKLRLVYARLVDNRGGAAIVARGG